MYFQIPLLFAAFYFYNRNIKSSQRNLLKYFGEKDLHNHTVIFRGKTEDPLIPAGIRNLCNTCYMNSVIQSLFATNPYREKVLSTNFTEKSVGAELQKVFIDLQNSYSIIDLSSLAKSLLLDINVQEDAEEFLLNLIDNVDKSERNGKHVPSTVLRIIAEQAIKCTHVPFESYKNQSSIDLALTVLGASDLHTTLKEHFKHEPLQGNTQYRTKDYGLQDAVRSIRLAIVPEVLVVHLKRFSFDTDSLAMRKVNPLYKSVA